MGALTTTLAAALHKPNVAAGVHNTVFKNDGLLPLFSQSVSMGNTGVQVKCLTAANSSAEVYSENQAAPARGYQQSITVTFTFKHIRVLYGQTGHNRRAVGSGWQASYSEGVDVEVVEALKDLRDLVTTTFMSTSAHGLEGIVDSSTDFGNQSRTTYSALKSYELSAASAALSTSLINKWIHRATDQPYGGNVELVIISPTQGGKWAEVQSGKVAVTDPSNPVVPGALVGQPRQAVYELPDLTNSVGVGLTGVRRFWHYYINEDSPGNVHFKEYGAADDSETVQLSTAGALVCTQPQRQTKLTVLSTG